MRRRLGKLGLIGFLIALLLAVAVYAYTGSFLLAVGVWAGPIGLAIATTLLLGATASEKRGWERQEDERIERHRKARHAEPATLAREELPRRRGRGRMGPGTAIGVSLFAVGLVYGLSSWGCPSRPLSCWSWGSCWCASSLPPAQGSLDTSDADARR